MPATRKEIEEYLKGKPLNFLARKARLLQGRRLSFYDGWATEPPAHREIREVLGAFLHYPIEWNPQRAAALLDCNPEYFSERDIALAVRAIWRTERMGFYKGAKELYANGWISKVLKAISSPKDSDAVLPKYPLPGVHPEPFRPEGLWTGYRGYWP